MVGLADVFGTFDENRFYVDGIHPTKEFLRQWYKRNQPDLLKAIEQARAEAKSKRRPDFREFLTVQPVHLPPEVIEGVSEVYQAGTNEYTDTEFFEVRPFREAVARLKTFAEKV